MAKKTYCIPQKGNVKKKGFLFEHTVEEERMVQVDRETYRKWKAEQQKKRFTEDMYMGMFDDE